MPEPIIWSDQYAGPRWTYGLTYRPLGTAQVPGGWILGSEKADPAFPFGTVQYPRHLTEREVAAFELTDIAAESVDAAFIDTDLEVIA